MKNLKEIEEIIEELKIISELIKNYEDRPDNIIRIIEFINNDIYDNLEEVN